MRYVVRGPRDTAYRPSSMEALEARVALSHLVPTGHARAAAPPAVQPATPTVAMGVLGDSYSDEYAFYPPDRSKAQNWVELLAQLRGVDFGSYSKVSLGEPRNQGYANDWALSGTNSAGMLFEQVPGLDQQLAQGGIGYVSVYIGANDLYEIRAVQTLKRGGGLPEGYQATEQNALGALEANVSASVASVLAANPEVKVAVVTLPPVTFEPLAQQAARNPESGPFLATIDQAIAQYDGWLANLAAANPRVALADFAGLSAEVSAQAASTHGAIEFGGIRIAVSSPADGANHLFLADRLHLGTVGQGMLADTILGALDAKFNAGIPLLSPETIVQYARQPGSKTR